MPRCIQATHHRRTRCTPSSPDLNLNFLKRNNTGRLLVLRAVVTSPPRGTILICNQGFACAGPLLLLGFAARNPYYHSNQPRSKRIEIPANANLFDAEARRLGNRSPRGNQAFSRPHSRTDARIPRLFSLSAGFYPSRG